MTLEQARNKIGSYVTYIPFKDCDKSQYESGIITSVSDIYVFVRFNGCTSQACNPEDLR